MSDVPRETLIGIIAKYGFAVCEHPKRCEALLRDLCGEYRREINILMGALEERVPLDLMSSGKGLPREALLARLTKRLQDQLAYTEDAARWAVDSWALALGVISSAEAEARAKAAASNREQAQPRNPTPSNNPLPKSAKPATPNPPPLKQPTPAASSSPPPRLHPHAPPSTAGQSTHSPFRPPSRPAHITSPPVALSPLPSAPPSLNTSPVARQPPPFTVEPRRTWIGKLRGCLLVVLLITGLIVAAVFAVPVIINLLRQEQLQPSINEPRIPRSN